MPFINLNNNQKVQDTNSQPVSTPSPLPSLTPTQTNQNIFNQSQSAGNQNIGTTVNNKIVETPGPSFSSPPVQQQVQAIVPQVQQQAVTGLVSQYSPTTTNMITYLDLTETRGASDLHISTGYPPMIRVDGSLEKLGSEVVSKERSEELLMSILTPIQIESLQKDRELDLAYAHKSGSRFRVNLFYERENLSGAFRLIPSKIRSIAELKLPEIVYDFLRLPHGLVLVTGPTGSGKSTSLAAMLNEINLNYSKHVVTIEDPIEYVYGSGKALIDQREVGRDTLNFDNALRSVLRQDPDVVLVGEMRDYKTISSTITIAETGHLVFATLHTNSAAETIDRIIDVFPEHQQHQIRTQLATVLVAVISQRLVPLQRGGRKVANEILVGTAAVKNAIREGKTYQIDNMIQTGADVGMFPLEKSLAALVKSGEITMDAALEFTLKPDLLRDLI